LAAAGFTWGAAGWGAGVAGAGATTAAGFDADAFGLEAPEAAGVGAAAAAGAGATAAGAAAGAADAASASRFRFPAVVDFALRNSSAALANLPAISVNASDNASKNFSPYDKTEKKITISEQEQKPPKFK
jgi:hypothetical protein